jgi:hypothetical protein
MYNLVLWWFSNRYQAAEKFSRDKFPDPVIHKNAVKNSP